MRTRAPRGPSALWPLWSLVLLASPVGADRVHLTNGGVIHGAIVERTPDAVVVETGPGRVTLPLSRVSRIVESESSVATFHERAAQIPWDDVEGLAGLARWAGDHDLATYSRHTWEQVLRLDPGHPEANEALGRVFQDGAWMSPPDAYRARGLVPFEGGWVTSEEHDALLREREAAARSRTDRQEAELRVREAEARAREAEARAREAESSADEGTTEGIPYWWVLSGGGGPWWPGGGYRPGPPTTLPERPGLRPPSRPPYRKPPSQGQSIWAQPPRPTRPPVAKPHGRSRGSGGRGSSGGSSVH